MGGYEGSFPSSIARCTLTTILQLHFTDGETGPQRGRDSPEVTQGIQGRTQTRAWTPGPVFSTLQGQLGQARQWRAEDIFIESESEVSKEKKKKKQQAKFPGLEPCPAGPRAQGGWE